MVTSVRGSSFPLLSLIVRLLSRSRSTRSPTAKDGEGVAGASAVGSPPRRLAPIPEPCPAVGATAKATLTARTATTNPERSVFWEGHMILDRIMSRSRDVRKPPAESSDGLGACLAADGADLALRTWRQRA